MSQDKLEAAEQKLIGAGYTVLIIDDHPLFCDALVTTLEGQPVDRRPAQIQVKRSIKEAEDLLQADLSETMPDLVLLDLNLPDVINLEGLARLRRQLPSVPILIISSDASNETIAASLRAGAAGYLPKESEGAEILDAIHLVLSGQTSLPKSYIEPVIAQISADGSEQSDLDRIRTLTPQQSKILKFLCDGLLNKQIAFELDITETTVKAHVSAVLQKLCVNNRTQAVLCAQRARLQGYLAATPDK